MQMKSRTTRSYRLVTALLSLMHLACQAGGGDAVPGGPRIPAWGEDIQAIGNEAAVVVAGVSALGLRSWDWGSSRRFHTHSEGWFAPATGSGGTDKLGHAFTSYALTNVFAERLQRQGRSPEQAALSAALTAQAVMLYVEAFDGFSKDHGFSREDVTMNLLGSDLAYARQIHPQLRETLDYRLEYRPSGYKGFRPLSDYEGQRYLLALKLGGFAGARSTPLRFFELLAGYEARGFSRAAEAAGQERRREVFWGVGLNLTELFLGKRADAESTPATAARLFLEHINIPGTSARSREHL